MGRVDWATLKAFVDARGVPLQYIDYNGTYYLAALDGVFRLDCHIDKVSPASSDQVDFENNYKAAANARLSQFDSDGAAITRNKAAKKGWSFFGMPLEFQTARLNDTLYSKDFTLADRSFITLKAYDDNGSEVTTPGLLNANYATIVKTVIDVEPPYDYEIVGGEIRTTTSIITDMRMWVVAAPDIPANMGGSKEFGGGINMKYLSPGNVFSIDGMVTKFAPYSATLHTNKLRLIIRYPAGTNEEFMLVIRMFKL